MVLLFFCFFFCFFFFCFFSCFLFYTPPDDSDGELWFHICRSCVCPSVRQSYVRPSVFRFRMITGVNINLFSPNLVCALILWRSGLGLLMGKFRQCLTELSTRDTIMAGYYSLTFLFFLFVCFFFLFFVFCFLFFFVFLYTYHMKITEKKAISANLGL